MEVSFHISLIPLVIVMLILFIVFVPSAIFISTKLMSALENKNSKQAYKMHISEKAVLAMIKAQNSDDIARKIELTSEASNLTREYELIGVDGEDDVVTITLSAMIEEKLARTQHVKQITADMELGALLRHFSSYERHEDNVINVDFKSNSIETKQSQDEHGGIP